ncbi:MAG: transglycosylase family protein [Acidimicrobiales bacterium]
MAIVVAVLSVPLLLIDYQSSAGAGEDDVVLSVNPEPTVPTVIATTTSTLVNSTTSIVTTVPPPRTVVPTTSAAPPSTAPPVTVAATQPPPTEPPATQPPATAPPATQPVDGTPDTTSPPSATVPPTSEPPATVPPSSEPPNTEPPATTPTLAGPVTPLAAESGDPTAEQWDALRHCESTNNYGAVSRSGKFRGAYQFSQGTWDWVAGSHHPELSGEDPAASLPSNQDAMALALTRMQSARSAWPKCAPKAGIS